MKKISLFYFSVILIILLAGCASTENVTQAASRDGSEKSVSSGKSVEKGSISLLFAGDVMAHKPNYTPGNFDRIWVDVKDLISSADLAFANIEAPVAEKLEWSTYPAFNMHQSYIQAAMDAGFDVFSLANNHTNDQLLDGINQTREYFASLKEKKIYACGVKSKSKGPLTYQVIEKDGWKILFVAVTQILNRNDYSSWIDFYPGNETKTKQLKSDLKKLREDHPCDLFVVSIHCEEPEYIRTVAENQKKLYREIFSECNADIVWANHPHVVKEWEIIEDEKSGNQKLVMYANGNTISAQRTDPQFKKPETARDFTGDGLFVKVSVEKTKDLKIKFSSLEPSFITTYKAPTGQYVIRRMDDDFIKCLERAEMTQWAKYLTDRKKIMEKTQGPRIWQ